VGLDLGDRTSDVSALDEGGTIVEEGRVQTTQGGLTRWFGGKKRMRVVMEVKSRILCRSDFWPEGVKDLGAS
jgi:hypothetical protein